MTILAKILAQKEREIEEGLRRVSLMEMRRRAQEVGLLRPFRKALLAADFAIIAEVKKASPSRGVMVTDFHPTRIAREYSDGGAHALSVLTDREYFRGDPAYLAQIKVVTALPLLRKDFIIDAYQVYESKALGADALLLIVKALEQKKLLDLYQCARSEGLDVLVEVHSASEVERAVTIGANMIGVNNRNLETFEVSLETSLRLKSLIPSDVVAISESGIRSKEDLQRLAEVGFHGVLVGESLITQPDRTKALRELVRS
jgi:indole-3-glycerol phosphate synthase